jgi:hypothetical protein
METNIQGEYNLSEDFVPVAVCTGTTAVVCVEFSSLWAPVSSTLDWLSWASWLPGAASECFTHSVDRLFGNTWPPRTTLSSVTKLFIPPSDRRLRRTTTSKFPSEHALNRHKILGHTNYAR